jgi:hypothetical protein
MFTLNDGMAIVNFVQGIAANLCILLNEGSRGGSSTYAKSWPSATFMDICMSLPSLSFELDSFFCQIQMTLIFLAI